MAENSGFADRMPEIIIPWPGNISQALSPPWPVVALFVMIVPFFHTESLEKQMTLNDS